MESIAVMMGDEYSADVTHNLGYRAGDEGTGEVPYTKLDIDVVHVLKWRDGKVIEGKGAIYGDGTTEYDQFWSPRDGRDGERSRLVRGALCRSSTSSSSRASSRRPSRSSSSSRR